MPARTRARPRLSPSRISASARSVADRVYDKLMPAGFFSSDGRFDRAALKSMSESFVDMKLIDHEIDLSQYVTEQFLPKE